MDREAAGAVQGPTLGSGAKAPFVASWAESRLTVLLRSNGDQDVRDLAEAIADLLVERGFAAPDEEMLRSVVYVTAREWPETPDLLVEQIEEEGAGLVIFPSPPGPLPHPAGPSEAPGPYPETGGAAGGADKEGGPEGG